MAKQPDYYEILGVQRVADQRVIRSAYRRLARQYHPDMAQGERSSARFLLIREAYEILSDPEKRRQYDLRTSRRTETRRSGRAGVKNRKPGSAAPSASRPGFHVDVDILGIHFEVGAAFSDPSDETDAIGEQKPKRRTS